MGIKMKKNLLALYLVAFIGQGVVAQSYDLEEIVVTADTIEKANIVDLLDLKLSCRL